MSTTKFDLVQDVEGQWAYAFTFKDMAITDPTQSECGRFAVEPTYYGLTAEDLAELARLNSVLKLARVYSDTLRDWLDDEKVRLVNQRNAARNDGSCASHDFCDANEALVEAFDMAFGREPCYDDGAPQQEQDQRCMNAATTLARANGFWVSEDPYQSDVANVGAYFKAALGESANDPTLDDLPVDSGCGVDCVAAIDAAKALITHVRFAIGIRCEEEKAVIAAVRRTVSVYWRG